MVSFRVPCFCKNVVFFGPLFTLFFFGSKKSYLSTSAKEPDLLEITKRKLMENVRCASECFVALITTSKEGKNPLSFYYAHNNSERTFE